MLAALRAGILKAASFTPPVITINDNFNRSNRDLNGDNGWVLSVPDGAAGFAISSNRVVMGSNSVTYPGYAKMLHDIGPNKSFSMRVYRTSTSSRSALFFGADPADASKGVVLDYDSGGAGTDVSVFLSSAYPSSALSNDGTYSGTPPAAFTGGNAWLAMSYDSVTSKMTILQDGIPFFRATVAASALSTYAGFGGAQFAGGADSWEDFSSPAQFVDTFNRSDRAIDNGFVTLYGATPLISGGVVIPASSSDGGSIVRDLGSKDATFDGDYASATPASIGAYLYGRSNADSTSLYYAHIVSGTTTFYKRTATSDVLLDTSSNDGLSANVYYRLGLRFSGTNAWVRIDGVEHGPIALGADPPAAGMLFGFDTLTNNDYHGHPRIDNWASSSP